MERNVLEFVDHLHENFLYPCSINNNGRYNVPSNPSEGYRCGYPLNFYYSGTDSQCSIEMHKESISRFEWPHGSYWVNEHAAAKVKLAGH